MGLAPPRRGGHHGLSPQNGSPVNAYPPIRPGRTTCRSGEPVSAAYVSGVAALVRPGIRNSPRIRSSAGYSGQRTTRRVVSTTKWATASSIRSQRSHSTFPPANRSRAGFANPIVTPPSPAAPPDRRARTLAMAFAGAVVAALVLTSAVRRARRRDDGPGPARGHHRGHGVRDDRGSAAGHPGAAVGLAVGLALLVVRWRRLPLWSWLSLYPQAKPPD